MKRVVVTNTRTGESVEGLLLPDGDILLRGLGALVDLRLTAYGSQPPLVTWLVEGKEPVTGYVKEFSFTFSPATRDEVRLTLKVQPLLQLPDPSALAERCGVPTE